MVEVAGLQQLLLAQAVPVLLFFLILWPQAQSLHLTPQLHLLHQLAARQLIILLLLVAALVAPTAHNSAVVVVQVDIKLAQGNQSLLEQHTQ